MKLGSFQNSKMPRFIYVFIHCVTMAESRFSDGKILFNELIYDFIELWIPGQNINVYDFLNFRSSSKLNVQSSIKWQKETVHEIFGGRSMWRESILEQSERHATEVSHFIILPYYYKLLNMLEH